MPEPQVQENQPNNVRFTQDPNVADKHMAFVNNSVPNLPETPQPQTQPVGREQYINPNNFEKVLNQTAHEKAIQGQPTPEAPKLNPDGTIPPMQVQYSEKVIKPEVIKTKKKGNETLKLVIYVVPILAIFILLLKSIDDEDVLWHVRQSLLAQGVWFAVLIVLRLIYAPIISDYGVTLWNLVMYVSIIIAGVQAYSGIKFHIPIIYETGKSFIENEK